MSAPAAKHKTSHPRALARAAVLGSAILIGSVLAVPTEAHADVADSDAQVAPAVTTASQSRNYWFTYPVGHATPTEIWNRMQTCFSCEVPVTGAPRAFPKEGDVVPFTLNRLGDDSFRVTTLYNFTDPTAKPGLNSGMILTATDKNIGGAGSVMNIDFLVRATDGQTVMSVSANVENDFGSSGRRHAYAQWEHDQWSRVAAQLQRG